MAVIPFVSHIRNEQARVLSMRNFAHYARRRGNRAIFHTTMALARIHARMLRCYLEEPLS